MDLGVITISDGKAYMPCVYEFVRDDVVLYVGRSDAGLTRVFRKDYKQLNRIKAFEEADQVCLRYPGFHPNVQY